MLRNAKNTQKLKTAVERAKWFAQQGEPPPVVIPVIEGQQEDLYYWLNQQDFFWNSDTKEWDYKVKNPLPYGEKEHPNMVFHLRVIAHPLIVQEIVHQLTKLIEGSRIIVGQPAFNATNKSKPYPDHEDTGERIYMEFRP